MWITVLIFAVAAIVGLTMALAVFQGRLPPIASAITHGVLAATGLVLLIVAVCHGAAGPARWALGFFLVAALGGLTLVLAYHARRKNLPANFVVGHATLAVIGLLLLLAGALHLI